MSTLTQSIYRLTCPYNNVYQMDNIRSLFVCSAGMLRSPTAAAVALELGHNSRSCGSSDRALIPLSRNLVDWAHYIYFMNEENYYEALETFKAYNSVILAIEEKSTTWDIDDIYNYNDFQLRQIVRRLLT